MACQRSATRIGAGVWFARWISAIDLTLPAPSQAERIAQVERDIRPPLVLRTAPVPPVSIQKLMATYAVPGVSVAFIDNGKVAWTRQWGWLRRTASTHRPVTARTLFQAISISKVTKALSVLSLGRDGKLTLDGDVT